MPISGYTKCMKLPKLDYTPLSKSPASQSSTIWTPYLIIAAIAVIGFSIGVTAAHKQFLLVIPVALALLTLFLWLMQQREQRQQALQAFAKANDLTLVENVAEPAYAGQIFQQGTKREITAALTIPAGVKSVEVGNYRYVTSSGRTSQSHHFGYVHFKLPRRLPHMLLDGTKNNNGLFSNLPDYFDKQQTLSLEGNFDKNFTLYVPQKYERDALYVFTPDVMQVLIDQASDYDIEIIDDDLFIYSSQLFDLNDVATWRKLLLVVSNLSPELEAQTDYYADERVVDRQLNQITEPGRRLKKGVNWVGFLIFMAFIGFNGFTTFGDSLPEGVLPIAIAAFIVIVLALAAGQVVYSRRRHQWPLNRLVLTFH